MSLSLIRRIGSVAAPVLVVALMMGASPTTLTALLMGASPGKVTICHKGSDLSVDSNAIAGHLGHGDRLGSCSAPPPCPPGDGSCWV